MGFDGILKLLQSKEEPLKEKGTNELYKKLFQPFMGFYRKSGISKEDAKDLIITSFIKIYLKAYQVKDPKKFRAWCWTIARNNMMDHFRKNEKYKNNVSEEVLNDDEIIAKISEEKEKHGDKEECIQLGIQEFAKDMPERALVMQLKMEELSNKDISLRIGRTLAATKEYVSRCYEKLQPYVEHCKEGNN